MDETERPFTAVERAYLLATPLGRLATIGPTGSPRNHPVTFWVNDATIDIGGPDLASSVKFRNIAADPRVSLVVDDESPVALGPDGHRGRGIEVRGTVEILEVDEPLMEGFSRHVLRLHPRRVFSWSIGPAGQVE